MSDTPAFPPPDPTDPTDSANPGLGVVTEVETPPDLAQELRDAFGSMQFRTSTTAALLRDDTPSVEDAMAAALGTPVTPPPAPPAPPAPVAEPPVLTPEGSTPPFSVDAPSAPDATTAFAPAAGDQFAPPSEPVVDNTTVPDPAAPPAGYDFHYVDPTTGQSQTRHLSDDSVRQAIGLASWANSLPDNTRAAFAAIEAGQAVAISRADYDQFVAFVNQTQAEGVNRGPASPPRIDTSTLDPDAAQAIDALQSQVSGLQALLQAQNGQQAQAPNQGYQPVDPSFQANVDANLTATSQAFDNAIQVYAQARHLTSEETERLVNVAVDAQIVPHFQRRYTQVNPVTGQILEVADPARVVYDSLDYALYQTPDLYRSVAGRVNTPAAPAPPAAGTSPSSSPAPPPPQTTAVPGLASDITAKRAQAASLATAPSAAIAHPPRDVRGMNREQVAEAMAADIARVMAGQ
jgi:hypothetical protein